MVGVLYCILSFRTLVLKKMSYSLCVLELTSSHQRGKEYGDNIFATVCMGSEHYWSVVYITSAKISQTII